MSHRFSRFHVIIALIAITTAISACAGSGASSTKGARVGEGSDDAGPVIARINGETIHRDAVDQWLKNDWLSEIAENPTQLYQLRRAGIDGVIDDTLIDRAAEKEGMSADAYLEMKTEALGPVTDEEVDEFYARNKDRIRPAQPIEQLRPKIRSFLENDRPVRVVSALRDDAKIEILLTPPAAPPIERQQIPTGGASRGPLNAPVTIVEFSDYQCPFCRQAEDTLRQLDALYPGQLRFEYRHLPLDFHPNAVPAAKAAICAGNQDRFWEYHKLLFLNQKALGAERLLYYATRLELDIEQFKTCQSAPETLAQVNDDIAVAKAAGASATPTFFVNGITLRGAQPADAFRSIIDSELARQQSGP